MEQEIIRDKIKSFIISKIKSVPPSEITVDKKLFSSGLLDSIVFTELLIFIEKGFSVKIRDKIEASMLGLDTIMQMTNLISSCLNDQRQA